MLLKKITPKSNRLIYILIMYLLSTAMFAETKNKTHPKKNNLVQENIEVTDFDLSNYFTKVSYIKLKHPEALSGGMFFGNVNTINKQSRGSMYGYGFSSNVFLTPNLIVAGDNYYGYYVYNYQGEYLYTLAKPDLFPEYIKEENVIVQNTGKMHRVINTISVNKNYALIGTKEDSTKLIYIYDLEKRKKSPTWLY